MATRDQRLAEFAQVAVCLEKREDFPAPVMLTQWAIESKWGAKVSGKFNLFGIKYAEGQHDGFSWVATTEHGNGSDLEFYRRLEKLGRVRNVRVVGKTPRGLHIIAMDDRFADYASMLDGARGYVQFLRKNPRYSPALEKYTTSRDPEKLVVDIIRAGYGTGEGYVELATKIIRQSNIQGAVAIARKMEDPCASVTIS